MNYMVLEKFKTGKKPRVYERLQEIWTARWNDLVEFEIIPVTSPASPTRTVASTPKSNKQVLVMRHDLKMRRGKQIAQAAHASMSFICRRLQAAGSLCQPDRQYLREFGLE